MKWTSFNLCLDSTVQNNWFSVVFGTGIGTGAVDPVQHQDTEVPDVLVAGRMSSAYGEYW